ncbi:hypothetical protein JRQ81_010600 [Phrynocephalus forsythii]|uniref:Centrosomal protein of 164 kDa n=1 Tax=Phrynocephalus forsythii TaxID=171643 RepID=A0A9Q1AQQ6_9SAUR|nr:hypothetical protein JRQ81_010600 [Phrynocephalus forsythii]
MAVAPLRVGDQLILEEDYDETYIPSEQEINEFARVIGIDPDQEPELMWLAREGIVAPLPAEWKPCQDVTGDIYYFNFANGQSTWDHPCDEHYRQLVIQEREKLLDHGDLKKKDRKKKREKKKEKQEREFLKCSAEMLSQPGILPSTSFYRASSPALSLEQATPDLEKQSKLTRNEPFLKNPKGKSSGTLSDPGDLPRLLSGPAPAKLHPLLPGKSNRTRQILADVEKILGRTSSSNRGDSGPHPQEDVTAADRHAAGTIFLDSEPENLDSTNVSKPFLEKLNVSSQKAKGTKTGLQETAETSLFLEGEKLSKVQQDPEGGGCCPLPGDSTPGGRTAQLVSSLVRDGTFLPVSEREMGLPPSAVSFGESLGPLSATSTCEKEGELGSLSKQKESIGKKKLLEPSQTTELGMTGREGVPHTAVLKLDSQLPHSPVLGVENGTTLGTISLLAAAVPGEPKDQKIPGSKQGSVDGGGSSSSSVMTSLADHLASQVLGEVDNFSWDLQSSRESDHPMVQMTVPKSFSPDPLHIQLHTSPDEHSESECYLEDQMFCQHTVNQSRGAESGPEPHGAGQNVDPDLAQEMVRGTNTRPQKGATTFQSEKQPRSGRHQMSIILDSQEKGQLEQHIISTDDDSQPGLLPEGDQEPDSGRKSICDTIEEEAAADLSPLSPNGGEEDGGNNKGPSGRARLLEKVHMDVSALGDSFVNEAAEDISPGKGLQLSAHLDTEPPVTENDEWLAQKNDQLSCSVEEEHNQGSAETAEREGRQMEGCAPKRAEEEADGGILETKKKLTDLDGPVPPCHKSLKTALERVTQSEELHLDEAHKAQQKLQTHIPLDMEAGKENIRLAQEAAFQKFREELESFQQSEEVRLKEEKQLFLERMKREVDAAQQVEWMALEQESQRALFLLKERLHRENKMAMEELEMQFARELQQQKSATEEDHQKVVSALQMQIVEIQRKGETVLHKALECAEHHVQQKRQQVAEYERELGDILKEKRQEVEQNHARQLEKIQEAHREALARIRVQHEEEEKRQKEELHASLQAERERLRQFHSAELEALQKNQGDQLQRLHRRHQEQEQKVREAELALELRARDVQARSAQLQAQEEAIQKRKQKAWEEEEQLEQQQKEAAVTAQLCFEKSQKERDSLAETIAQLHQAVVGLQSQKVELESQVEQLQRQASELEENIKQEEELLRKNKAESSGASLLKMEALQVEDLQDCSGPPLHWKQAAGGVPLAGEEQGQASCREMASQAPKTQEEDSHLVDQVRQYISAEGASLKTAKEFLAHQAHVMQKRQAALRDQEQHWNQDFQEAKQLDELKVVQRCRILLKKKEEMLRQLESSLVEELSEEDLLKGVACKKGVTFDLSDLEDTDSPMSPEQSAPKDVSLKPPDVDKIQCLTDSLQRISRDLNSILGLLTAFSTQQPLHFPSAEVPASPLPQDGIPLSAYAPVPHTCSATPGMLSAGPPWAWRTGFSPRPPSPLASQSVDSVLMKKWRKYFPGGLPLPCRSSSATDGKLGSMASEEHFQLFQSPSFQPPSTEKQDIQGMIDDNKKWLEDIKQVPKVHLLPSTQRSSASSPGWLHLGLDENNRIKVYRF